MKPTNLNEVIDQLNLIIEDAKRNKSRIGYFAALYKRMTIGVKIGIANGMFEDGNRMEMLDVNFANRYLDAYNLWKQNKPLTASWQIAFNACGSNKPIVLQHLLLGVNAHINLDLGLAASETVHGIEVENLKTDFNKINEVIGLFVNEVQDQLTAIWWPMRFIDKVANKKDEAVINFSIIKAREHAWYVATHTSTMNAVQRESFITTLDKNISTVADRMQNPGFVFSILQRVVRFTEEKDIIKVIEILDK